jgi:hypothetical protein
MRSPERHRLIIVAGLFVMLLLTEIRSISARGVSFKIMGDVARPLAFHHEHFYPAVGPVLLARRMKRRSI